MQINDHQKELIEKLIQTSKELGHSPKRREVPKLAFQCYRYFSSFNEAKKQAGLSTVNTRILDFTKEAFQLDKNIASIASYLTFDGHLYKDLKGFMYCSSHLEDLKEFENLVKRKFGNNLREIYHLNSGGSGKRKTHKIYFFNKKISAWLFECGVPKGNKVLQSFNVPDWIISSKEFSREYLRIAFLCEGCFKEETGRTPRIQINLAKNEEIINSNLEFMENLKLMLRKFDINTTKSYVSGRRIRKDGNITRDVRFRIDIEDNNKFIKEIGWFK